MPANVVRSRQGAVAVRKLAHPPVNGLDRASMRMLRFCAGPHAVHRNATAKIERTRHCAPRWTR